MEISYTDQSLEILGKNTESNTEIKINNTSINHLFGQAVHIWNTGNKPIDNLRITYFFEDTEDDLNIYDVIHNVSPLFDIKVASTEKEELNYYRRFLYTGLDPNEDFSVLFLTNKNKPFKISMNAPGLMENDIIKIDPFNEKKTIWSWLLPILTFLFGILVTILILQYTLSSKIK
jgi:hypothetical protein